MPTIIAGEDGHFNSDPVNYVTELTGIVLTIPSAGITPSMRVIRALQSVRPEIKTKGFRKNVRDAIFYDTVEQEFSDDKYRERYLRRLYRWTGKNAICHLQKRCEILDTWINRDSQLRPDAYLVDKERCTVVCYEVEDSHPLNPFIIGKYAAAWWTLEYIYWNLHLIAYDIYGNYRIIQFPESRFIAQEVRKKRKHPLL